MLDQVKLRQAQAEFLTRYPGGFDCPELQQVSKKHNMTKMNAQAREYFSRQACHDIEATAENMVRVVSRSSMVSLFEKPKYRDFVRCLNTNEKALLVNALYEQLHGKKQAGFEAMVEMLAAHKLAKWSLISIIPAYYFPSREVFVKPTTAKGILRYFEVEDPVYKPRPSWDFYRKYRKLINDAKKEVGEELSPSNAAFSGFLMMTVL